MAIWKNGAMPFEADLPGASRSLTPRRGRSAAVRILFHIAALLIAVGCFALYAHFEAAGRSGASLVSLIVGAVFALVPVRDLLHVVFGVEGKVLHFVHAVGGAALI